MHLPHGKQRRRLVVVVVVATAILSTATGVAAAQSVEGASGTIVVGADETRDGISAVAGTILVRGTVTGDVSGVAGSIHVTESGSVEGSISGAAGDVRIAGRVGGDLSAGSGNVVVTDTATIGGDVEVGAGNVRIDGRIDGDVRAGAETLVLGPDAEVGGEFRYDAGTFTQDPAATVEGGVVRDASIRRGVGPVAVPPWVARGYGLLANLLLGALLLLVFPAFSAEVATRVSEEPAKAGGVGLLTLVGVPFVLALIAITIIGIPFALLGAVVFGVSIWVAVVYGQYAVGAWVLREVGRDDRWLALVAGLVGFTVLGAVPVLGAVLELGALLLGVGALALGLRDAFRDRRGSAPSDRQTTFDESFEDTGKGPTAGQQPGSP